MAAPSGVGLSRGDGLFEVCSSKDTEAELICTAFIVGVVEGITAGSVHGATVAILATRGPVPGKEPTVDLLAPIFADCSASSSLFGWSAPEGIDNQGIRDVVVKWLREHPEQRQGPSALLVRAALRDAWPPKPCPKVDKKK
jgi:hypothetical protein